MKSMGYFAAFNLLFISLLSTTTSTWGNASPSLSQKMLKSVIEYQCEQELKSSKAWKAASLLMSAQQQKSNQQAVCACVSEHAMDNIAATDLLAAAVNETEKNKLLRKAVFNSIRGCTQQALN